MASKKGIQKAKKESFATQFEALEAIVESLESDDLDVDRSIAQFEEGLKIAARLKKQLATAENTIETLKKKYE